MKRLFLMTSCLAVLAACFVGEAKAQQLTVDVEEPEITLMPTPQFNCDGETKRLPKAKTWIEIECEFEIKGKTETGFIDELEFIYYVMMEDGKTLFVESVTHVNIQLEETLFSDMFISPTTLRRILGREVTSESAVAGAAVEVKFRGGTVGGASTVSGGRWWEGKQQTRGMLLKKSETPFAPLWSDRYADVKKGG